MLPLDKAAALGQMAGFQRRQAMRYPEANWYAGPGWKQGYDGLTVNACAGAVCHSMVGGYYAAISRLQGSDRASWHFSIRQDGTVYQHYELEAVTWHAGSPEANGKYVGIEHEGGATGNESEPLTAPQLAASIRLVRWLSETCDFPLTLRTGLWEHRWLSATACPSSRIPWDLYAKEGRVYTDAEIDKKVGEALKLGVRNQEKVDDLANAVNALDGRNGHTLTLKGLWYIAGKLWPFG